MRFKAKKAEKVRKGFKSPDSVSQLAPIKKTGVKKVKKAVKK